jgi:hypothetical protein
MLEKIKEKCDKKDLTTKITTRTIEWGDGEKEDRTELFIQIPSEREHKTLIIDSRNDSLQEIFDSNFEEYKFISGYEGIY